MFPTTGEGGRLSRQTERKRARDAQENVMTKKTPAPNFYWKAHHDMFTDRRWGYIARQANTTITIVGWLTCLLRNHASQQAGDARGSVRNFNTKIAALDCDVDVREIDTILSLLREFVFITEDDRIADWDRCQAPKDAAERKRDQRAREAEAADDDIADVTNVTDHRDIGDNVTPIAEQSRLDQSKSRAERSYALPSKGDVKEELSEIQSPPTGEPIQDEQEMAIQGDEGKTVPQATEAVPSKEDREWAALHEHIKNELVAAGVLLTVSPYRLSKWREEHRWNPKLILETVSEVLGRRRVNKGPIANLIYFEKAIAEAHEKQPKRPDWDERVARFKSDGHWHPLHWGGKPDAAGCDAPPGILEKHGFSPAASSNKGRILGAEIAGMTGAEYQKAYPKYFAHFMPLVTPS
jgi:hypothetical protein